MFTSYLFLLILLPVSVLIYWSLMAHGKSVLAKVFLLIISIFFCGMASKKSLAILIANILINYFVSFMMRRVLEDRCKQLWLIIGIVLNISLLGYCKYTNFFIKSFNTITGNSLSLMHLILPLGISYYTFSQISYLSDVFHGKDTPCSFLDYALFVSWMPKIIEGPITYERDMVKNLNEIKSKVDYDKISYGLRLLAVGLIKKTILAGTFSNVVTYAFGQISSLSTVQAWMASISYSFQLYFDFSGYCDMAIGISKMFGIDLPINFNSPYKADSVNDFWKRWHITLTGFLREYIYIPLGGNRKGKTRTYINVILVYLISGFWHGAGYTFIVWGLMHGIASCIDRMWNKKFWCRIPRIIRQTITFVFVNSAWVIFRSETLSDGIEVLKRMFIYHKGTVDTYYFDSFILPEWETIETAFPVCAQTVFHVLCMVAFMFIAFYICFIAKNSYEKKLTYSKRTSFVTALLLLIGIMSLTGTSQFIYAGF